MITEDQARLFGCSRKELRILRALQAGQDTPLLIARATKISRPGTYDMLMSLRKRGIVTSQIRNGKKTWSIETEHALEERLYEAKKGLLQIPEGTEKIHGRADSAILVHRGKEAIRRVMFESVLERKGERMYGFQGDVSSIGWDRIFTAADTNRFNRAIKKNGLIVDAVLPEGWFEQQAHELGLEWAKEFEGRATRVSAISPDYFVHGGQMFLFKDVLYLMALNEEILIEIRHSEIQKMVLAFFKFMQDKTRSIDANALLRTLIDQAKG